MTEMSSKIAIFFSGRIHGFETALPNLQKYKSENTIFFISLNSPKIDEETERFFEALDIRDENCINIEETNLPDEILKLPSDHRDLKNAHSMFYHNSKCFEMIEKYQEKNNVVFNIIMKYRSEIISEDIIKFSDEIISYLKENTVYIPDGHDYYGINDQIAYGKFDVMKKYCSVFENIKILCLDDKIIFCPERILLHHLNKEKIIIERITFDYSLDPTRK